MRLPRSLRARLLVAFLVVAAAALGTVGISVLLVGPGYFAEAMGHLPGDPMAEPMAVATLAAFTDAMREALVAATVIAVVTATVVSLAVAARIARPITMLADAARRVAGGHYAERVGADEPGELGDLATSFNEMAGSLEATERRRLQLVGDVAHELRTPLTTLDGYLEGLEDGVISASPQTWHLLRGETARLTRMVTDLSELWRAEAHQLPFVLAPIDVAQVAREVAAGFAPAATARAIGLDLPDGAALATADRDRVGQILSNFLSNALRHAPDGSTIRITTASTAG
ncbi:MAG: HAMP domain-containing protein, partial [Candidatus Limnocylindrales bacterium]